MRGLFPARSWLRPAGPAVAVPLLVLAPLLAGCKGIDESQWTANPLSSLGSGSGSGSRSESTSTTSGGGAAVTQRSSVQTSGDSGVVPGGAAGARRFGTSSLVVRADPSTCWVLVVDGKRTNGCGNATLTDTRGERAGRVTKVSGSTPVRLQLLTKGRAVDSGEVKGNSHYVTVRG